MRRQGCLHCGRTWKAYTRGLCLRYRCYGTPEVREKYPQTRGYRYWTSLEEARLMELVQRGLTWAEIGNQLGRTGEGVRRFWRSLNQEIEGTARRMG